MDQVGELARAKALLRAATRPDARSAPWATTAANYRSLAPTPFGSTIPRDPCRPRPSPSVLRGPRAGPSAPTRRDGAGQRPPPWPSRACFSGPEIKTCTEAKITPMVPKPMTSNAKAQGRFSKADFIYIAKDDEYQCPAGQRAIYRMTTVEKGLTLHRYWPSACPRCPLKARCTPGDYRRVTRWEHEAILETMQRRLDRKPEAMTLRRRTIEHVFGTRRVTPRPEAAARRCC